MTRTHHNLLETRGCFSDCKSGFLVRYAMVTEWLGTTIEWCIHPSPGKSFRIWRGFETQRCSKVWKARCPPRKIINVRGQSCRVLHTRNKTVVLEELSLSATFVQKSQRKTVAAVQCCGTKYDKQKQPLRCLRGTVMNPELLHAKWVKAFGELAP